MSLNQTTPEASAKWITLKEWSGGFSAERVRETFARPPGAWRLSYKTEPGELGKSGVVDIIVRSPDERMVTAAYNLQGSTSGTLMVKGEQPQFIIEISSFGPRWRIAVEQAK